MEKKFNQLVKAKEKKDAVKLKKQEKKQKEKNFMKLLIILQLIFHLQTLKI